MSVFWKPTTDTRTKSINGWRKFPELFIQIPLHLSYKGKFPTSHLRIKIMRLGEGEGAHERYTNTENLSKMTQTVAFRTWTSMYKIAIYLRDKLVSHYNLKRKVTRTQKSKPPKKNGCPTARWKMFGALPRLNYSMPWEGRKISVSLGRWVSR